MGPWDAVETSEDSSSTLVVMGLGSRVIPDAVEATLAGEFGAGDPVPDDCTMESVVRLMRGGR